MVGTRLYRNLHEGFYGEGPTSLPAWEQVVNRRVAHSELRRAQSLGSGLWIQARLGVRRDQLRNFRAEAPALASSEVTEHLQRLVSDGPQTSFEVGLDAGRYVQAGGVQVHLTGRIGNGELLHVIAGLVLDRTWHFSRHRRLTGRLLLDRTLYRQDWLPYYFLPRLDARLAPGWNRFRFFGNDRLVAGATYVHPLIEILKSHAYEAIFNLGLSQVYDDIGAQFSPRIAVSPERSTLSGRAPLEPTFGVGSQLVSRKDGGVIASVILGFSVEGLQAGTLRITQRLSEWYTVLR